ncbi:MAG: alpha-amylase family glycosyl hydrolase, partial [Actinomycetes bacterium]
MTQPSPAGPWWRDAVIYQIYIRSFADSDGDGVGDLAGIRSRLPYLRDLGVDAIWVTPFYPSPMADGGYDVADYRDIEPMFGTLDDADALIADAHDLGLRVIIDIVPNHTSDQHAWFQAALAAGPGSPERARYIFRPGRGPAGAAPPTDWESVFGGSAWKRLPDGDWYLHLFAPEQPDLDWENPEIVEDFHATLRFWLDRGVDGFRIDVANSLTKDQSFPDLGMHEDEQILAVHEGPGHPFWDRDDVHEIYRGWRRVIDEYDGERVFVGEAWVNSPERLALYVRPGELHTAFNFQFLRASWDATTMRSVIDACIATMAGVAAPTTWVLSNHDVTRHPTRYARLDDTGGGVGAGQRVGPDTPLDPARGLRRARAATLLT